MHLISIYNFNARHPYRVWWGLLWVETSSQKNLFLKPSVSSDCRISNNKHTLLICMPTGMPCIKVIFLYLCLWNQLPVGKLQLYTYQIAAYYLEVMILLPIADCLCITFSYEPQFNIFENKFCVHLLCVDVLFCKCGCHTHDTPRFGTICMVDKLTV